MTLKEYTDIELQGELDRRERIKRLPLLRFSPEIQRKRTPINIYDVNITYKCIMEQNYNGKWVRYKDVENYINNYINKLELRESVIPRGCFEGHENKEIKITNTISEEDRENIKKLIESEKGKKIVLDINKDKKE